MFAAASTVIFGRMLDEMGSCNWHLTPYQCQRFLEEFRRVCCSELAAMKPVPLMFGNAAAKSRKNVICMYFEQKVHSLAIYWHFRAKLSF